MHILQGSMLINWTQARQSLNDQLGTHPHDLVGAEAASRELKRMPMEAQRMVLPVTGLRRDASAEASADALAWLNCFVQIHR